MIVCPVCGHENDDTKQFCRECGAPLKDAPEKIEADTDDRLFSSGSFDDDDSQNVSDSGSFDTDSFDTEDDALSDAAPGDTTESLRSASDNDDRGSHSSVAYTSGNDASDDADATDDEYDEEDEEDEEEYDFSDDSSDERYVSAVRKKSRKAKPEREGSVVHDVIFMAAMVVLTALVVLLSIVYIRQTFPGDTLGEKIHYIFTSTFTDGMITKAPTIEEDETSDGEPAVRITVYARRGCVVCFREGATIMERTVEGQSIAFRVPTSLWTAASKNLDVTSVDIVPNVFVYDPAKSNEIVQLEFEPYSAALQSVKINITNPASESFTTSSLDVPIEGNVSDRSVAVYMNGNQLQLDEGGYFRTVYHIPGDKSGEYEIKFTAQKSGFALGSKTITVNYSKSKIDLEIYNEDLRTFTDTIEISGKVKKGVELEIKGVETEGEVKVDRSGEFSFTALVPTVGNYAVTFNMKDGDKSSSTIIYIEHAPDINDFVSSTTSFDYDWLVEHPTMYKQFGITGTIKEVYQTEPYVRARLHTSDGDVVFVYYYTTEVSKDDNKTYRIYCYPDGTDADTGLPQVYCWFIHKS